MQRILDWMWRLPRWLAVCLLTLPILVYSQIFTAAYLCVIPVSDRFAVFFTTLMIHAMTDPVYLLAFLRLLDQGQHIRKKLRALANSDPLSGLLNRRAFFKMEDEMSQTDERKAGLRSVICFDIDHFKTINDSHGHLCGDAVIQHFSEILRGNARQGDLVARFGGEEFVIQANGATMEGAVAIAERIRIAAGFEPVIFEGISVHYTVSAGVVTDGQDLPVEELIRKADACLYAAKSSGRNRVVATHSEA